MKATTNLEEEKRRLEMELKRINDQMEAACRMDIPRMITIREVADFEQIKRADATYLRHH